MNPPPEATYNNVDVLKAECRQHVVAHLYSVTTKRSDYKMGVLLLHCGKFGTRDDRHGLTEETRQRPSSSILTGCPFLLQGRRNRIRSWTLRVKCGEHNHPSLTHEATHPSHRKMTNNIKEHVRTLSVVGVAPIRSEPSSEHIITCDVYNLKRQHRIEQLDGRMPMEALLSSLIKLDVPNTHCVDASGRLTRLTFTNTKAIQLTCRFGTVLTMDCTYKMNRFKMPLLHIVSFACIGATFTLAIAFLSAEMIEDYEWALNTYKGFMGNYLPLTIVTDRELALMRATEIAFPVAHKMLCQWHICKNVVAKHRTGFTEEDWQTFMTLFSGVMRAGTKDELQEKLVQIQMEWVGTQPRAVQYVLSWMQYKTYFIGAYVDRMPHFESSSSSRVEGAHSALKQRL
jgi:histone-lysine N-methyltransferase SETD2